MDLGVIWVKVYPLVYINGENYVISSLAELVCSLGEIKSVESCSLIEILGILQQGRLIISVLYETTNYGFDLQKFPMIV